MAELLFQERGKDAKRLKMEAIAEQLEDEFGQNLELTRESLYPLVEEAVRRGFVRLTPPVSRAFRDKLVAKGFNVAVVNEPDAPYNGAAMSLATEPLTERTSAVSKVVFHLKPARDDVKVD